MAHRAIARVFGFAERDDFFAGAAGRRIKRKLSQFRHFGKLRLTAQLEHQEPRDIAHRRKVIEQIAIDRNSIGAAPSGQHGDILLAINRVSDRRCDNAGLRGKAPKLVACCGAISVKLASCCALEDKAAARCQQSAIPRAGMFNRPFRLLRDGIPRD